MAERKSRGGGISMITARPPSCGRITIPENGSVRAEVSVGGIGIAGISEPTDPTTGF
jgi:hypothetical protein